GVSIFANHRRNRLRTGRVRVLPNSGAQPRLPEARRVVWFRSYAVPPTVKPSIFSVGRPTPTGTFCPSLPHEPTPASSARSLPISETLVSASGPLPISVAPFTGYVSLPSSIIHASPAENTNLPLVMSTWPPPKFAA